MRKRPSNQTSDFEIEPEEIQSDSQLLNNIKTFPPGIHLWRQQGPYLVCTGCELQHAIYVGMDKLMVGEENGKPILKSRQEVFGNK